MPGALTAEVTGEREFYKAVARLEKVAGRAKANRVLLKGARKLQRSIRRFAPWRHLRAAIVAKAFKSGDPGAFAAVDYRKAPDANLAEHGVSERRPVRVEFMKFEIDGRTVFTRRAAPIPARPFFRPGVMAVKNKVTRETVADLKAEVEKVGR